MTTNEWFFPAGTLRSDPWEGVVDSSIAGWRYTGIRIGEATRPLSLPAGEFERMVIPLSGSFEVRTSKSTHRLEGRSTVFSGPTDVLYLGVGAAATVSGSGRVAVAEAPSARVLPDAYIARKDVPVEVRGRGRSTRQVHNFGVPGGLEADKLLVCEVITPAENWSSYPGHKHDSPSETESVLEEIYYFESAIARGHAGHEEADPFGLFTTYSSPAGTIDTAAMVRTGDIALVPHGYHGPAAAAPGYDLYYLNVMAGPGDERAWRISDDPAHSWIRGTWEDQEPDPRLPIPNEEHP